MSSAALRRSASDAPALLDRSRTTAALPAAHGPETTANARSTANNITISTSHLPDETTVSDKDGPDLPADPRSSRPPSKSRTGSGALSHSVPQAALRVLLGPGDMIARGAPPPEVTKPPPPPQPPPPQAAPAPPPAGTEAADTIGRQYARTSEASSATEAPAAGEGGPDAEAGAVTVGMPNTEIPANEKTEKGELTAFQYADGRVKIQHPGLGDRNRTYYPYEIRRIEHKNDLLKSNAEKAIEGEAQLRPDAEGKIVLTERAGYLATGYSFPTWKKWWALFFTALIQVSMNYNTSCYSNAVPGIVNQYHVSAQAARVGQMIYLVAYSFGCELWAPWSEEFGRKPILQLSLTLVNSFTVLAALAPNFGSIVVSRFLCGLFTANGGVTLAVVADMFEPDEQQYALAFMVLFSCFGVSGGAFIGGFLGIPGVPLIWNFWSQLCFNGLTQLLHFFLVPETRATILLDREARRRRRSGEKNIWGPNEAKQNRLSFAHLLTHWIRPFEMFVREPIVLFCSLLSGFSDMLIFIFQESFSLVFGQWGFTTLEVGLAFLSVLVGYVVAWGLYLPRFAWELKQRKRDRTALAPEARLTYLLFLCPWEILGLFGFAWTSLGPPQVHWMAPLVFSALISMANYAIYFATVDYMIAAYGPYSASACGGNALARDFLAGISAMFAVPMYDKMGYEWASTLLAFASILIIFPIYLLWYFGPTVRERSVFAQTLAASRERNDGFNVDEDTDVEAGTVYTRNRRNTSLIPTSPAISVA